MDNIALLQQLDAIHGQIPFHSLPGASKPRLREVLTIPCWVYCFLTYVVVQTQDPTTRDQLMYARLIIQEALRHGGSGWLDYDRVFCQQVSVNPSLPAGRVACLNNAGSANCQWSILSFVQGI